MTTHPLAQMGEGQVTGARHYRNWPMSLGSGPGTRQRKQVTRPSQSTTTRLVRMEFWILPRMALSWAYSSVLILNSSLRVVSSSLETCSSSLDDCSSSLRTTGSPH